jgi:hypothetical protein
MLTKKNRSTLINVGFFVCVIIGVINLLTVRQIWILLVAVSVMIILILITINDKRNLDKPKD